MTTDAAHALDTTTNLARDTPAAPPTPGVSRRRMLLGTLSCAAAAGAVTVLGDSTPAAAGTSTMYAGAANNAGPDSTSLSADLAGATLNVYNPTGFGLAGESSTLYGGYGTAYGVNLTAGLIGVQASGGIAGVSGNSAIGTGVVAYGAHADIALTGDGPPPSERGDIHSSGEMLRDVNGAIWVCVQSGSPRGWRKLGDASTAGSLHVIEPTRVYDSRWPDGMRHIGGGRGVYTNFGRNLTTGAVEGTQLVPAGARALSFTVTAAARSVAASSPSPGLAPRPTRPRAWTGPAAIKRSRIRRRATSTNSSNLG